MSNQIVKVSRNGEQRISRSIFAHPLGFCAAISVSLVMWGSPGADALAQSAPKAGQPQHDGFVMEQIVVTAQKREQNLQDVGISVTAQTGEDLRRQAVFSSTEVAAQTPGLNIGTPVGEGNNPSIVLRGVGLNDFGDNNESPVGVYIDNVYYGSLAGQTFQLFDLQRVEVLRGPQGTLYGRNTTGGLIHYISKRPSSDPEGYIDLSYGSYNSLRVESAVNTPLGKKFAARLSGEYSRHDGIIENLNPNNSTNPNNGLNYAGRLQLQYSGDATKVLLNIHGARNHSRAAAFKHASSFNNADGLAEILPSNVDFYGTCPGCDALGYIDDTGKRFAGRYDQIGANHIKTYGGSVTLDIDLGSSQLTSITAGEWLKKTYIEDSEMSPFPYADLINTADNSQFSQEVRLSGQRDKLHWLFGAYYFELTANLTNRLDLSGLDYVDLRATTEQHTHSWALFGQLEYAFSEYVKLITGLRYTHDRKNYSYISKDLAGIIPGNAFEFTSATVGDLSRQSAGDVDFRAELDVTPIEDVMLYASISRGHKGGGFNQGFFDSSGIFGNDVVSVIPFKGEQLTSYEVGFKSMLGQRTRLNADVYYYDYQDYQALSFRQLSQVISNADSRIYGAEIELETHPIDGLLLSIGASLLDAKAKGIPDPLTMTPRDRKMVLAPNVTLNGKVQYEWNFDAGHVIASVDGSYQGAHYFDIQNHPATREDGYFVGNATLTYLMSNENLEFRLFVKNFTGTDYRTYVFNLTDFFGSVQQALGWPRWYGGGIRYSF